MRCNICPLFECWNNENDSGEACAIFGDAWDSRFQYEDKHGTIIGCYIEKAYINKVEKEIEEHYDKMAEDFANEQNLFLYSDTEDLIDFDFSDM